MMILDVSERNQNAEGDPRPPLPPYLAEKANEVIESYRMFTAALLCNLIFAFQTLGGPRRFFFAQHEGCDVAVADFMANPENPDGQEFLELMWQDYREEFFEDLASANGRTADEEREIYEKIKGGEE